MLQVVLLDLGDAGQHFNPEARVKLNRIDQLHTVNTVQETTLTVQHGHARVKVTGQVDDAVLLPVALLQHLAQGGDQGAVLELAVHLPETNVSYTGFKLRCSSAVRNELPY